MVLPTRTRILRNQVAQRPIWIRVEAIPTLVKRLSKLKTCSVANAAHTLRAGPPAAVGINEQQPVELTAIWWIVNLDHAREAWVG
jgi:hypothetical protein